MKSIPRGKNKSIYLNHLRAIHKKVRHYCKIHNIHRGPQPQKMNILYREFLNSVGEEVPEGMSLRDYMLELYNERKYSFLSAIMDRPDIPPRVWRELRKKVFETYGRICLRCNDHKDISVDHIKPYSLYPELCIEFTNLQPLCRSCNSKKGTKIIDYRHSILGVENSPLQPIEGDKI